MKTSVKKPPAKSKPIRSTGRTPISQKKAVPAPAKRPIRKPAGKVAPPMRPISRVAPTSKKQTTKPVAKPAKRPPLRDKGRKVVKTLTKLVVSAKAPQRKPEKIASVSATKVPKRFPNSVREPNRLLDTPKTRPSTILGTSVVVRDNGKSRKHVPLDNGSKKMLPPSTPDNAKPRKPNAGLSARDLDAFRDLLMAKRRELIGDMSAMEREALRTSGNSNLSNLPIHMADMGTDNYEQEFTLGLVQKDRDLLKEINLALAKMQNGTYGFCDGTGEPIIKERLEFQPWARYSIEHQKKLERHGR